jgi:copper chaperone CopZ
VLPKVKLAKLAVLASVLAFALPGISALGCVGYGNSAKVEAPVPANAVTATFRVIGMHCSGCEERVQNALHRVDGIYKVDVRVADSRVIVTFDHDKVSADAIAGAIAAAGFQAAAVV